MPCLTGPTRSCVLHEEEAGATALGDVICQQVCLSQQLLMFAVSNLRVPQTMYWRHRNGGRQRTQCQQRQPNANDLASLRDGWPCLRLSFPSLHLRRVSCAYLLNHLNDKTKPWRWRLDAITAPHRWQQSQPERSGASSTSAQSVLQPNQNYRCDGTGCPF